MVPMSENSPVHRAVRPFRAVLPVGALAAVLAIAGCGGSGGSSSSSSSASSSTTASAKTTASSPTSSTSSTAAAKPYLVNPSDFVPQAVDLTSPAFVGGQLLPTRYRNCGGSGTWPPLKIVNATYGKATKEYVLMAVDVTRSALVRWAVGGIRPSVKKIAAGKLPPGAIPGRNSAGSNSYDVCPGAGHHSYLFQAYALRTKIPLQPGFDAHALRARLLKASVATGFLFAVSS
jgi:phosphatidylethanolamine-binding protein (PEBP) family uncharacterized protein